MINAGCTCLSDARGNVDEEQKMKTHNFIKKLIDLIRRFENERAKVSIFKVSHDLHESISIVYYKHIKNNALRSTTMYFMGV